MLYTADPDGVRAVLRDAFGWTHVDAGDGWLIFALPPAEVGVHPGDAPGAQLSLMCDDIEATVAELLEKGVQVRERQGAGWGVTATIVLPGDLEVMLYQPRHPTAI